MTKPVEELDAEPFHVRPRTNCDALHYVDMNELDGLSDSEVVGIFRGRAEGASTAQLGVFLDGFGPEDEAGREALIRRYVASRMATIEGLRGMRAAFTWSLDGIAGE